MILDFFDGFIEILRVGRILVVINDPLSGTNQIINIIIVINNIANISKVWMAF
jgi:hypothetical protein